MADKTVVYRLQAEIGQFRAQMAQASASTKKLATDLTSMDKSAVKNRQALTTLGSAAGRVGLVAAAGLAASAKAAVDWESAFAGVEKTVDGTATQMASLEGELRELARTMPATHAEIAATAEAAGQLGVAREDVAAFTETMLMLGETTNLNADEAATSLARFSNIMGTSSDDVGRLGAAVVGLGNNFATTEAEVVEISTRLAAAGNQAGLTEADIFGVAAAMSSVGVEAEAGGTAMSKVFTSIGDAVRSGDGNLQTFAEVAGVTADEFQRLYDTDPSQAIGAFVEGMGQVAREGGNTSQIFKDLGLTDQRLMRAILSVGSATGSWAEATGLANEEWEKGTALTDEFAKRAGTTASEMTVAWNNVKDAAIDVGAAALPVLSQMASGVSAAASAFSSLPGPIKSATGAMMGVTAVLGGGLWFTTKVIGGIASTREALEQLGVSSTKASRAMKGVGIAAGAIAGLTLYVAALRELQDAMDETLPGAEELEARLISLAETPDGFTSMGLGREFDSLADSIDRIADPGKATAISDVLATPFGGAASMREATAEIEALDSALAGLVSAGHADIAADSLDRLAEEYRLTEGQVRNLKPLLTGYNEALQSQANDAKLAGEGAEELGDGMADAATKTNRAAEAAQAFKSALERVNAMLEGRASLRDYEQSLDDFTKGLKENGRTLDINTQKGRDNQAALDGIVASTVSVAETMKGSNRVEFLKQARKDFVDATSKLLGGDEAARKLWDRLVQLNNTTAKPKIEADASGAINMIDLVRRQMEYLDGLRATTYVDTVRRNRVSGGVQEYAAGGYVTGPGTATSDSIPAWLSNREYVIKAAAVDKYGVDFFHRINAMRFAEGGLVGRSSAVSVAAPNVSVGGPQVRVFIDGSEVRAVVDQRISDHRAHDRAHGPRGLRG